MARKPSSMPSILVDRSCLWTTALFDNVFGRLYDPGNPPTFNVEPPISMERTTRSLPILNQKARRQSPVPLSEMVCGEPEALSVNVTVAPNEPMAVGWKTRDKEQLAPGVRAAPQLLLCRKELAFAPVI